MLGLAPTGYLVGVRWDLLVLMALFFAAAAYFFLRYARKGR